MAHALGDGEALRSLAFDEHLSAKGVRVVGHVGGAGLVRRRNAGKHQRQHGGDRCTRRAKTHRSRPAEQKTCQKHHDGHQAGHAGFQPERPAVPGKLLRVSHGNPGAFAGLSADPEAQHRPLQEVQAEVQRDRQCQRTGCQEGRAEDQPGQEDVRTRQPLQFARVGQPLRVREHEVGRHQQLRQPGADTVHQALEDEPAEHQLLKRRHHQRTAGAVQQGRHGRVARLPVHGPGQGAPGGGRQRQAQRHGAQPVARVPKQRGERFAAKAQAGGGGNQHQHDLHRRRHTARAAGQRERGAHQQRREQQVERQDPPTIAQPPAGVAEHEARNPRNGVSGGHEQSFSSAR